MGATEEVVENENAKESNDAAVAESTGLLTARRVAVALLTSNIIGIALARSVHYQFYVWYFYSLPLLLWSCKQWWVSTPLRVAVLLGVEYAFNVFPATPKSSLVLLIAHAVLIFALLTSPQQSGSCAEVAVKASSQKVKKV